MSLTVLIAANSRRLTTVDAVIQDIGAEGLSDHLLLVESLIDQASAAIERACNRIFAQQTYVEMVEHQRATILLLSSYPLLSVANVALSGTTITDYSIKSISAGLLYRWPSWWSWGELPEATITYTAGYVLPEQTNAPVPAGPTLRIDAADVERACLECVKVWLHERVPSERIQSKTLGLTGDRIDYGISATRTAIPVLAQRLLDPWRRMAIA